MSNLQGKTAIVTGAATGIGRAIAARFVRAGAHVVIDYHQRRPRETEREAGDGTIAVQADVSDPSDVQKLVDEAVKRFDRLDIIVNNAGVEQKFPLIDTPLDYWNKVVAVNLTGPFLCSQAAAKRMVRQGTGGRIINISSVHEDLPMPTNGPYCVTKGGLRMLMRTMAVELAQHKITVNNIAPGAVETPINAELKDDPKALRTLLDEIPLHRMGQPDEVAQLCAFLASDDASYITGSTYVIDGGLMRQSGSL